MNDSEKPQVDFNAPRTDMDKPPIEPLFVDTIPGDWFVLHTKSRQEKRLSEELTQLQIPHYLPLRRTVKYYGNRKFHVEEPLFSGYVFMKGQATDAYDANRNKRIANIIPVPDQDRLHWELKNLSIALGHGARLDPFPFIKLGSRVEVRSGPFRGLQGIVEARAGFDRLILQVDMLGRAMSIDLHGAAVEPID